MHAHNLEKLEHITFWGTIKRIMDLWPQAKAQHKKKKSLPKHADIPNIHYARKKRIYLSGLISYLQTNEN